MCSIKFINKGWQINSKTRMNIFIKIRWSDEYWQYRVAANITEYQNKSSKIQEEKAIISCI